jgi:hypothetical protein
MRLVRLALGIACAAALQSASLLAAQHGDDPFAIEPRVENGVPFATGGVGKDQRETLLSLAHNFNLKLVFALVDHRAFLTDVPVRILDPAGKEMFTTTGAGPWLYAKLPPGKYRVAATIRGRTLEKTTEITERGRTTELAFYW